MTACNGAAIFWRFGCWFCEKTTDSQVLTEGQWRGAERESGEGTIRFRAWRDRARQLIEPLLTELQRLPIGQQPIVTWANSEITERGGVKDAEGWRVIHDKTVLKYGEKMPPSG